MWLDCVVCSISLNAFPHIKEKRAHLFFRLIHKEWVLEVGDDPFPEHLRVLD